MRGSTDSAVPASAPPRGRGGRPLLPPGRASRPAVFAGVAVVVLALVLAAGFGVGRLVEARKLAEARGLYEKGRYEQAERMLREVLERDGGDVGALRMLARVLAARGDAKAAVATFERALANDPSDAPTLAEVAGLERLTGDSSRAAEHYAAAVKEDPRNAEYKDQLARTLLQLGRDPEAAALWGEIAADGTVPVALRRRAGIAEGQAWLAAGDRKRARDALGGVLSFVPKDPEAVALLGKVGK